MDKTTKSLIQAWKIVYEEEQRVIQEEKEWRDFAKSLFGDIDYLLNLPDTDDLL